MTAAIFGHVLPFAVWEVAGGIEYSGAVCARILVVPVDVFDAHHHGVGHRTRLRDRAAVAVGGHHDERRIADPELRTMLAHGPALGDPNVRPSQSTAS